MRKGSTTSKLGELFINHERFRKESDQSVPVSPAVSQYRGLIAAQLLLHLQSTESAAKEANKQQ